MKPVFLVLVAIAFIRTVAYGTYCLRQSRVGGISVFFLALGVIFCGIEVYMA